MTDKGSDQIAQPATARYFFSIRNWLVPFCLSDKFKFATKVALSLMLAFLIPLALGWPQASTAATTVMLIASTGSRRESLAKGTLRVLGTLVGAVIGLLLVGLFAQDRLLYMLTVSIVISFVFYIRNAYKQDPTLFMLTGVMILMMSNGGDAGGAFIYGVDRAYMTVFGVVVYTLVGIFVFPTKTEQNLRMLAAELGTLQLKLFERLSNQVSTMPQSESHEPQNQSDEDSEVAKEVTGKTKSAGNIETEPTEEELVQQLYAAQNALEQRYSSISAECSDVSAYKKEWDLALYYYKKVTQLLIFVAQSRDLGSIDIPSFITNYNDTICKIEELFASVQAGWGDKDTYPSPVEHKVSYDVEALNACSHLQKGSLITLGYILNSLHENLSRLAATVYCIDSVTGRVSFEETVPKTQGRFLWWDAENAKTAIKVFVTYWVAGILWIYFNPPGGYSFVIFSTIFVSVLSYLPVHPVLLLVLFTFGFLFAVPSYIFILPQLSLGVELGAFIFIYTFIGFYLFKGPITIFFLIGLFILGIDNTMTYHFGIILTIILLFYLVVLMIIFSYYFPFSSRPEHLFLVMRERFFRHVCGLLRVQQLSGSSVFNRLRRSLHVVTMNVTVKKLILWSSKVDQKEVNHASPEAPVAFAKACNLLCNHLNTFIAADQILDTNVLVNQARVTSVRVTKGDQILSQMAKSLAGGRRKEVLNDVFHAYSIDYESTEQKLESFFNSLSLKDYSDSEIAGFYILLNLKKNVYQAMNQCKVAYEDVNWPHLRQMKF